MQRTSWLPALTVLFYLLANPVLGQDKNSPPEPEQKAKVEKQGRVRLGGISIGAGYSRYGYRSPSLYNYPYYYRSHYPLYHPFDAWAHPGYYLVPVRKPGFPEL